MNALSFFNDPELLLKLKPFIKREVFKKGDYLQKAGTISKKLYIIKQGLIRVFYIKNGREICCHFASEGEAITGIDSFFTARPSIYTSEAIEDTICHSLTKEQLEAAYDHIPGMNKIGREFVTAAYIDLVERYNSIVCMTAEERYHDFMAQRADLLHRVPLGYISSYLGMTQETLSRVRSKKIT